MGGRLAGRALATLTGAVVGAVLLSGSDEPVTAHAYPHWQQLAAPPISARTHALGVHVLHRVLVLGGLGPSGSALRDGAAYDVRTGIWHRLRTPVAFTDRDRAAAAAGIVVLAHQVPGHSARWWRYDLRGGVWSRMRHLRPGLSAPSAFGSEVYALSGRRVMVYSVQLDRWTPLPLDRLRPRLTHGAVTASRDGTVVTGFAAGHPRRLLSDRWDGLRWRRTDSASASPVVAPPNGATRVAVGGRVVVVRGDQAWIHTP
jgi:hypothetical protein